MKEGRKLRNWCHMVCMVLLGVLLIIDSKVVTVQAASQMVVLKADKTYTNYDFTRDGKRDRFKCTADSERGYARIYLNGKFKQRIFIGKGADIYWCKISTKDTYLLTTNYLYGGHDLKAYMYSGGKFKSTPGEKNLNKVFSFSNFKKVKKNTLYVESSTGGYWRNPYSFKNVGDSLTVETQFTVKNNKITCKSWTSRVTGRKIFYAKNSFSTSKSMSNLNVKNGPRVKAGQKVTLNYIRLNRTTYLYQISVNGQKGWFADSENIKFS